MAKAKKIAVINQKGGVGKSTTALSLGAALHHKGKKVLFVDLDAQGNLSGTLRARPTTNTVLSLLKKELKASDIIQKTDCGDLLPSSPYLSGADAAIVELGKERRLRDGLKDLEDNYDYIIFDTPPALGIVTINALTAADGLVIPSLADVYSMQGINQLHLTVESVREYTVNTNLKIYGVLLTRFNRRSIISREVAEGTENTAKQMGTTVFNTRIRECTAIREAQAMQQDIYTYAPKSNASEDNNAFTNELLEVIERA